VNHWRVGFGSDTEGAEQFNVGRGTTTTRKRALQNLALRIPQVQQTIIKKIGPEAWGKLGVVQKSALSSLTYNYGHLPVDVYLRNPGRTAAQIGDRQYDNGGVNKRRRVQEANFYMTGTLTRPVQPTIPAVAKGSVIAASGAASAAVVSYLQAGPGIGTLALVLGGCLLVAVVLAATKRPKTATVSALRLDPPAGKLSPVEELKAALVDLAAAQVRVAAAEGSVIAEVKEQQELLARVPRSTPVGAPTRKAVQ